MFSAASVTGAQQGFVQPAVAVTAHHQHPVDVDVLIRLLMMSSSDLFGANGPRVACAAIQPGAPTNSGLSASFRVAGAPIRRPHSATTVEWSVQT
ncbi:hypothetical protein [Kibdelosporangium philippinense]|uniref:hypothetical protein n=1 Tax=Kibdelosporangium philippinense TaxID=211113 RepID=UPI0036119E51